MSRSRVAMTLGLQFLMTTGALHAQIIDTIAGTGSAPCAGDGGFASLATFLAPYGVAVDAAGNIFVVDPYCEVVRRIDASTQIVTKFAGTYNTYGYAGDGGAAANAVLASPIAVAVDAGGNLFIADAGNNCIRRVDAASQIITTYAGQCTFPGFGGDNIPATNSMIYNPLGLAVDASGNLFIGDSVNYRIRRVDASAPHIITTVAGTGVSGFNGDNIPATSAQLDGPYAVAVDGAGNRFISDTSNFRIRRVDSAFPYLITTIAGTGVYGFNGNNIPATSAQITYPWGVIADDSGNIFFSDQGSDCIRQVGCDGLIQAAAGTCLSPGFSGDGGPAPSAQLNFPTQLALDGTGNLLIADVGNGRIRRFHPIPCVSQSGTQFCITGTSSGAPYAWWLDVLSDNANQASEPYEPGAPGIPAGAPATVLASEFSKRIKTHPKSMQLGITSSAVGACFTVSMPTVCSGGLTPNAPCVVSADCPGGGVCAPEVFSLLVGPANTQPTCTVTVTGCTYNPLITLGCTSDEQCDDGNPCSGNESCGSGACHGGTPISAPAEAQDVRASGDKITYVWSPAPDATSYAVVRGAVSGLAVGPGGDDEVCLDDLAGPSIVDHDTPVTGAGFWYLARGENACGRGNYGKRSGGAPRITSTCP
jgi:hypothetical protein